MKTGLFGGGWEDYIQPVNDHFDNLAANIQIQGAHAGLARMDAFDGADPANPVADGNAAGAAGFWQDNPAPPEAGSGAASVPTQPGVIAQQMLANSPIQDSSSSMARNGNAPGTIGGVVSSDDMQGNTNAGEQGGAPSAASPGFQAQKAPSGQASRPDWGLTHQLESIGPDGLYVPYTVKGVRSSGATLGYGIDVSQYRASELRRFGMPGDFIKQAGPLLAPEPDEITDGKLRKPLTGDAAQAYIDQNKVPLTLDPAHLAMLQQSVEDRAARDIRRHYDDTHSPGSFDELSDSQKKTLLDLAFYHGSGFGYRDPSKNDGNKYLVGLWNDIKAGDWDSVATRLNNSPAGYASRSAHQACILQTGWTCPPNRPGR